MCCSNIQKFILIVSLLEQIYYVMKDQYCKVGNTKSITSGQQASLVLEHRYQLFLERASGLRNTNKRLAEFFESKALQIRSVLDNLV